MHFLDGNDTESTEEELRVVWFEWPKERGLLVIRFEDERADDIGRSRKPTTMEGRCELLTRGLARSYMKTPLCMMG